MSWQATRKCLRQIDEHKLDSHLSFIPQQYIPPFYITKKKKKTQTRSFIQRQIQTP